MDLLPSFCDSFDFESCGIGVLGDSSSSNHAHLFPIPNEESGRVKKQKTLFSIGKEIEKGNFNHTQSKTLQSGKELNYELLNLILKNKKPNQKRKIQETDSVRIIPSKRLSIEKKQYDSNYQRNAAYSTSPISFDNNIRLFNGTSNSKNSFLSRKADESFPTRDLHKVEMGLSDSFSGCLPPLHPGLSFSSESPNSSPSFKVRTYKCVVGEETVNFVTWSELKGHINNISPQELLSHFFWPSPSFPAASYSRHFRSLSRCSSDRILFLEESRISVNSMLKKIRKGWTLLSPHFSFALRETEVEVVEYTGPTDLVGSYLRRWRSDLQFTGKCTSTGKLQIFSLEFRRSYFPSFPYNYLSSEETLMVRGSGFSAFPLQISISFLPEGHGSRTKAGKIFVFHSEKRKVHMITSSTLLSFLPPHLAPLLQELCMGSPSFCPKGGGGDEQMFFLEENLSYGQLFYLRRVKQSLVWHLFLEAHKELVTIDCRDFTSVRVSKLPASLISFYSQVIDMVGSLESLNKASTHFPRDSTLLNLKEAVVQADTLTHIKVPPLEKGDYVLTLFQLDERDNLISQASATFSNK